MRACFVFIDGVGLGADDPAANPLAARRWPAFETLADGQAWTASARPVARPLLTFRALDARLGVKGLPQSGTGQATLFTGVNCAALAGRHWGPFPHSTSKPVLARDNLLLRLVQRGRRVQFVNAYPDRFFEAARARDRWTVTSRCCLDAGVPLLSLDALRAGEALAADVTAAGLRAYGLDVPVLTPAEAGRRLATLHAAADLTLFEYFHTDKAGHAQDAGDAERRLADLDAFLAALIEALDPERDLLLLTSDHGNLEDLTTRSHTLNDVPLVARGAGADAFASAEDLTGVTPRLLALLA